MSFKNFSTSHPTPSDDKPDAKAKAAPSVDQPAPQPGTKQDDVAPGQKS